MQRIIIYIPGEVIIADDFSVEYGLESQNTNHKIKTTNQDKVPVKDDHVLIEFIFLSSTGLCPDHFI